MRYTVVAVGKLKERFWRDACAEYVKRLGAYAKVDVREVPDVDPARAGGIEASREREGQTILTAIPDRSHVILLAIDGKQRSSEAFSAHLDELAPAPTRRSRSGPSPCRITWHVWSFWSRSIAPARSAAASPTTSSHKYVLA